MCRLVTATINITLTIVTRVIFIVFEYILTFFISFTCRLYCFDLSSNKDHPYMTWFILVVFHKWTLTLLSNSACYLCKVSFFLCIINKFRDKKKNIVKQICKADTDKTTVRGVRSS